jgi:hypothetical protein
MYFKVKQGGNNFKVNPKIIIFCFSYILAVQHQSFKIIRMLQPLLLAILCRQDIKQKNDHPFSLTSVCLLSEPSKDHLNLRSTHFCSFLLLHRASVQQKARLCLKGQSHSYSGVPSNICCIHQQKGWAKLFPINSSV